MSYSSLDYVAITECTSTILKHLLLLLLLRLFSYAMNIKSHGKLVHKNRFLCSNFWTHRNDITNINPIQNIVEKNGVVTLLTAFDFHIGFGAMYWFYMKLGSFYEKLKAKTKQIKRNNGKEKRQVANWKNCERFGRMNDNKSWCIKRKWSRDRIVTRHSWYLTMLEMAHLNWATDYGPSVFHRNEVNYSEFELMNRTFHRLIDLVWNILPVVKKKLDSTQTLSIFFFFSFHKTQSLYVGTYFMICAYRFNTKFRTFNSESSNSKIK